MTVKSIVDIDIDDGKFQRFTALFDKYQTALAKTPNAWKQTSAETAGVSKQFEKMAAALMAQSQLNREASEAAKAQAKHLSLSERLWTSMAKSTKSVASNIYGATKALLSWSGIVGEIGGLLGAGGLWGIDRMAASAAGNRRSSMGLGLSTGEQSAFKVNFARAVDPDAYLSWVNQIETDPTKSWSAYALGVRPTGKTGEDSIRMLDAIRSKAKATPLNQLGLLTSQYGLEGTSVEDLRRLRSMSDAEYGQLKKGYGGDVAKLGVNDNVGKQWQDFTTQMERAKSQIFKTFVEGLAPLAGPLSHLSDAFVKFLSTLMKSDLVRDAITNLSKWLENFSGNLSAPKFLDSVQSFMSDIGLLADAIHKVTHPGETIGNWWDKAIHPDEYYKNASKQETNAYLNSIDAKQGLPIGTSAAIFKRESNSNFNPADSTAGAVGPFQIMPRNAAAYGFDPHSFSASSSYEGWQMHNYMKKYNGDIAKALAAYNWGEGNKGNPRLDADIAAHGNDWLKYAPKETQNYVAAIRVEVVMPPGNNAVVSSSQLIAH